MFTLFFAILKYIPSSIQTTLTQPHLLSELRKWSTVYITVCHMFLQNFLQNPRFCAGIDVSATVHFPVYLLEARNLTEF